MFSVEFSTGIFLQICLLKTTFTVHSANHPTTIFHAMIPIHNHVTSQLKIGFITADNVDNKKPLPLLEQRLQQILEHRKHELTPDEDLFRKACRDMLRIGSYKPTGRSKPSSEYLLRSVTQDSFPRINTVADINNYISLKYVVPISLWDTSKIAADSVLFRPGRTNEQFVFNPSGQTIGLTDLVTGFAVSADTESPIITPVKDCQQTKTDENTNGMAVAVYYPSAWEGDPALQKIVDEYAELLKEISETVESRLV